MDWVFFLPGMLGALLTVYLAKQEIVPEFRPLFDTSKKEKEAGEHRGHIKETEKHIDDLQAKLEAESVAEEVVTRLTIVLNTSLSELREERTRLQRLEREIKQNQVISRGLGFLFYIVLGGVFGALLAGKVQVEGMSGKLSDFFKSIVIGATWTSYLSVLGFSQVGKKVDEKVEATKKEIVETIEREAKKTGQSLSADMVAEIAAEKLDTVRTSCQREIKRIL